MDAENVTEFQYQGRPWMNYLVFRSNTAHLKIQTYCLSAKLETYLPEEDLLSLENSFISSFLLYL